MSMSDNIDENLNCYVCGERSFDRCDPCWKPICYKHHNSFSDGIALYCPKCYRKTVIKDKLSNLFVIFFFWAIGWYLLPDISIPFKDYTLKTFLGLIGSICFFIMPFSNEINNWIIKRRPDKEP